MAVIRPELAEFFLTYRVLLSLQIPFAMNETYTALQCLNPSAKEQWCTRSACSPWLAVAWSAQELYWRWLHSLFKRFVSLLGKCLSNICKCYLKGWIEQGISYFCWGGDFFKTQFLNFWISQPCDSLVLLSKRIHRTTLQNRS